MDEASLPPSISKTLPVTQDEASDTRYRTAQAMSSGSPGRRIGVPSTNCCLSWSSVSTDVE
jgi:hypothetical protein